MKRLFWLALFTVAAWWGWNHRDALIRGQRGSEVVITNDTDVAIVRVRVGLGPTRVARERIEAGESVHLPFAHAGGTGAFRLEWGAEHSAGEYSWEGGTFLAGPVPTRHHFHVLGPQQVTWSQERMGSGPPAP